MNVKQVLLAAATIALLGSQPATASTITASYLGAARLGNAAGVGYESGSISPAPGVATANVLIGGDSFSASPNGAFGLPSGPFDAWCVDIYHWLASPSTFTIAGASTLASDLNLIRAGSPNGAERVADLERLANAYYDSLDTRTESAAFQLAVWAITYGSKDGLGYHLNTSDSNFHVDGGTAASAWGVQANAWLGGLSTASASSHYNLIYLRDATGTATQDMVVFVKTAGGTVPEPGTALLVGAGLLAAAGGLRRKA